MIATALRSLSVLLAALTLAGCALLVPQLQTPELSIVDVQLGESSLWEQNLQVRMRVQNPNDRALPIRGLSYTLEVAGQEFARGVSGASFTVPALGEAEFDMTVRANMASALIKLLGRGEKALQDEIEYRLVGTVNLSQGLLRTIPFEERGTFRLK